MTSGFVPIDRLTRVAPLGLRFLDDRTGRAAPGLSVVAHPRVEPRLKISARMNTSGVYYFVDVPGLRDLEFGAGDDQYWATLSRRLEMIVRVGDPQNRFLPFLFQVSVPHRGVLTDPCSGSPPPAPPPGRGELGIPLFSASARPSSSGLTTLRAQLWDPIAEQPAAYAVLEAITAGARTRGESAARAMADDRGLVTLFIPCPDEDDLAGGPFDSPSSGGNAPLGTRSWSVDLSIQYSRLKASMSDPSELVDLCAALDQPNAVLWSDAANNLRLERTTLTYGREHVLRSSDGVRPPSVVFVTPAGSPP